MTTEPIVSKRKLRSVGASKYVLVPKKWLVQHGNPESVIIVANRDMKVLSPESAERVYKKVTEIVEKEE